jgi:hypothetical protein
MKEMRSYDSLVRLGGTAAFLLGITRVLAGGTYLLLPAEQRLTSPGPQFLPSFAQDSSVLMAIFWIETAAAVIGLLVIPAVTSRVRGVHEGWARWASTLATIGYAVSAVGFTLSAARIPGIARAFVAGDASTKAALAVVWRSSPDLFGLWGYGAIGIWLLVVCLLGLRNGAFPRLHMILGIVAAANYLVVPLGLLFKISALFTIGSAAGIILGPVWYFWAGLVLLRPASSGK